MSLRISHNLLVSNMTTPSIPFIAARSVANQSCITSSIKNIINGNVRINNVPYSLKRNSQIYVVVIDDVPVMEYRDTDVHIWIEAEQVDRVLNENGDISVISNTCGDVKTENGTITVNGNCGTIKAENGSVTITNGSCSGDITTENGSIYVTA